MQPSDSLVPPTPQRFPNPAQFFTPFIKDGGFRKFSQSDFQKKFKKFLADAYINVEISVRRELSDLTPDSHAEGVDMALQRKIQSYGIRELKEMSHFYREFFLSIAVIMKELEQLSRDIPSQLVEKTIRGLEKLGAADSSFSSKDKESIAQDMMKLTMRLNRFNLHVQKVLDDQILSEQAPAFYNTKLAWVFYMALLGLAVGISLHFMPLVGVAIAIPVAVQWLALLVNITVPAFALTVGSGLMTYFALNRTSPQLEVSLKPEESSALRQSAEELLVDVMRQEMIVDAKVRVVEIPCCDLARPSFGE